MAVTFGTIVKLTRSFLWLMFFILIFSTGYDALFFHGLLNSPSRAPGISSNWLAKPYTNLRLSAYRKRHPSASSNRNDWAFVDVTFSSGRLKALLSEADKKGNAFADRLIKP